MSKKKTSWTSGIVVWMTTFPPEGKKRKREGKDGGLFVLPCWQRRGQMLIVKSESGGKKGEKNRGSGK